MFERKKQLIQNPYFRLSPKRKFAKIGVGTIEWCNQRFPKASKYLFLLRYRNIIT